MSIIVSCYLQLYSMPNPHITQSQISPSCTLGIPSRQLFSLPVPHRALNTTTKSNTFVASQSLLLGLSSLSISCNIRLHIRRSHIANTRYQHFSSKRSCNLNDQHPASPQDTIDTLTCLAHHERPCIRRPDCRSVHPSAEGLHMEEQRNPHHIP
jgi:hypothetical protein